MSKVSLEQALMTDISFNTTVSLHDELEFDKLLIQNNHYAVPLRLYEDRTTYRLVYMPYIVH